MKQPLPRHETDRLDALQRYDILDTLPEQAFDDLARLAAQICQTPIALITLVDADRQWFKSKVGLTVSETPRDVAFCAHTIVERRLLIVPDTSQDDRFASNPLVTGEPKIRFYVGVPLMTPDNFALGTLCAIDYVPRELSSQQQEALEILARQVVTQLELRRHLLALQQVNQQQQQAELALQNIYAQLETKVTDRTAELVSINQQLCSEIAERRRAEEEVQLLQKIAQAIGDCGRFANLQVGFMARHGFLAGTILFSSAMLGMASNTMSKAFVVRAKNLNSLLA